MICYDITYITQHLCNPLQKIYQVELSTIFQDSNELGFNRGPFSDFRRGLF